MCHHGRLVLFILHWQAPIMKHPGSFPVYVLLSMCHKPDNWGPRGPNNIAKTAHPMSASSLVLCSSKGPTLTLFHKELSGGQEFIRQMRNRRRGSQVLVTAPGHEKRHSRVWNVGETMRDFSLEDRPQEVMVGLYCEHGWESLSLIKGIQCPFQPWSFIIARELSLAWGILHLLFICQILSHTCS